MLIDAIVHGDWTRNYNDAWRKDEDCEVSLH